MIKLLIADDEEIIRMGLKQLIENSSLNIEVCCVAEDGEEAFHKLIHHKPEIVLMDINMPLLNGLDSIEKIREIDKNTKIIIISGYDEFKYAQRAISLGVFAYILKPINYKELFSTLKNAIESYEEPFNSKHILTSNLDNSKNSANEAINYINNNFTNNTLTLTTVAQLFHMSQSNLTKLIKQKTGLTFIDYLNSLRINLASKLLKDGDNHYTIAQISETTGYNSQHYFSRVFKNHYGVSPNKYR